MRKLQKILALAATTVASTTLLSAGQAHAALVTPPMNMSITPYATYHRVCVSGSAVDALQFVTRWELTIEGSRSSGAPIAQSASSTDATWSVCQNVSKSGALQGEYHVAFTFAGVGPYVYGKRTGYGSWQPALADLVGTLPV